ncbi:MAG TPA: PH domain-containing protein [Candidatus Acidoferrum sp.]|nr:PH domain-containing protein [Candidatus Acidoferrum sp.]
MSYIDTNLLAGEQVVYRARLHPIIFAPGTVVVLLGILIALAYAQSIGLVVGVIGVVMGAIALVRYNTSEFAVTNRRVIIKVGALGRRSLELELNRVEGIDVDQSAFGRLFDYGTIGVRGIGGTEESFPAIAAPLEFRKYVQEMLPQ